MKYLLDTCVISDFLKGNLHTLQAVKSKSPTDIAVSTITVMELEYGLALNANIVRKIQPVLTHFLSAVNILSFTASDATCVATMRALLKQQGSPIGAYDILLAGVALNNKLIFVTSNTREFSKIPGLILEDWRQLSLTR